MTITAKNLKALKHFEWSPSGVCALVGPNGSGKSTALRVLEMIHQSLIHDYNRGIQVFGAGPLTHFGAGTSPELSVRSGDAVWSILLSHEQPTEKGTIGDASSFNFRGGTHLRVETKLSGTVMLPIDNKQLALSRFLDKSLRSQDKLPAQFRAIADYMVHSHIFSRPDLLSLKDVLSSVSDDAVLDAHGRNLFTVLRNWRDQSEHEHRLNFVNEQMAEIFPKDFRKLDFKQLGNRQSAELVGGKEKLQPTDWSDGFFTMLIHLTSLASVDGPGIVAIDEPENSLHPERICQFVEAARMWSEKTGVTVVLATHSPVLLDQFKEEPEKIFVMQPGIEKLPVALDTLKKRDWLQHFSIGDLYSHLEVGAG